MGKQFCWTFYWFFIMLCKHFSSFPVCLSHEGIYVNSRWHSCRSWSCLCWMSFVFLRINFSKSRNVFVPWRHRIPCYGLMWPVCRKQQMIFHYTKPLGSLNVLFYKSDWANSLISLISPLWRKVWHTTTTICRYSLKIAIFKIRTQRLYADVNQPLYSLRCRRQYLCNIRIQRI